MVIEKHINPRRAGRLYIGGVDSFKIDEEPIYRR